MRRGQSCVWGFAIPRQAATILAGRPLALAPHHKAWNCKHIQCSNVRLLAAVKVVSKGLTEPVPADSAYSEQPLSTELTGEMPQQVQHNLKERGRPKAI